jgi:hypothetical protein
VRRLVFALVALVLVVATLETIAAVAFTVFLQGKHFRWRDLDALGTPPTQAEMDAWRTWGWDRELGWLRSPSTRETIPDAKAGAWTVTTDERGARAESFAGAGGLVSAYGDSFTFGHEVEDDETWPHYLSQRLGTRVDNWGQTAWGPDQSVLRLRRNLPDQHTAVVVLAIMSENIARVVNCYRPFLSDQNMKMAFKPMLVAENGALGWFPSPLSQSDTPADFAAAFARATEADFWYAENERRVRVRFPYLLQLPAVLAFLWRQPGRLDLYADRGAVARLDGVLAELQQLADANDFVPVVLFLPEPVELKRFVAGRRTSYRTYVEGVRRRAAGSRLVVVDLLDHPFDAPRFNRRPFADHPSPYGNQVIADVVAEAVRPLLRSR